ncbi:MAG: hypothetical protein EPN45_20475 [Rhizobiaceae bacterium]|nr:MAG: hypothetical protein EPN45_20475 [Rhizobiaceae bacterium]
MPVEIPQDHDAATIEDLEALREIAKREGFTFASMRAMATADASIRFLAEVMGTSTTEMLIRRFLGAADPSSEILGELEKDPMPDVLRIARSPEFWSEHFQARGIRMSARTLRQKALKSGHCYHVDKQVLITPAQVDGLFRWRGTSSAKPVASAKERSPSRGPSAVYLRVRARLVKEAEDRKAKNRKGTPS